jgi:hypothetical protein
MASLGARCAFASLGCASSLTLPSASSSDPLPGLSAVQEERSVGRPAASQAS